MSKFTNFLKKVLEYDIIIAKSYGPDQPDQLYIGIHNKTNPKAITWQKE